MGSIEIDNLAVIRIDTPGQTVRTEQAMALNLYGMPLDCHGDQMLFKAMAAPDG